MAQSISQIGQMHTTGQQQSYDGNGYMMEGSQGIDGISIWYIYLVNILFPQQYLYVYRSMKELVRQNIVQQSIQQGICVIIFQSQDQQVFYVSFEVVQIPMYMYIGQYGSYNQKVTSQYYIMQYTLGGSQCFQQSIVYIYSVYGSTGQEIIMSKGQSEYHQKIIWVGMFISFAVKVPMFPFHIWQPQVHTEAPTTGSVLQAGVIQKFGSYGMQRYQQPICPQGTEYYSTMVIVQGQQGVVYSSVSALSQVDQKQIIAYSSIVHMNIGVVGQFSKSYIGIMGAYIYTQSHGLVSGGQFQQVGMVYERYKSRNIKYYRGQVSIMPVYSVIQFVQQQCNMSFPVSQGYIGEMMIYMSSQEISGVVQVQVTMSSVVQPILQIWTYHKVIYGKVSVYQLEVYSDMTIKEWHMVIPQQIQSVYQGVNPGVVIGVQERSVVGLV